MKVKAVYDNGGASADRYTIVYDSSRLVQGRRLWECVGSSMNPTHPQGFFQHSDCTLGRHLGKKIAFADLPEEVQRAVNCDLAEEEVTA
jgi:hypothetical protein